MKKAVNGTGAATKAVRRKIGRPDMGLSARLTTSVPDDLYEWAMTQPEGVSLLLRILLLKERERREHGGEPYIFCL
jgi:hypothetical protein